jgi:hypothetical protein
MTADGHNARSNPNPQPLELLRGWTSDPVDNSTDHRSVTARRIAGSPNTACVALTHGNDSSTTLFGRPKGSMYVAKQSCTSRGWVPPAASARTGRQRPGISAMTEI